MQKLSKPLIIFLIAAFSITTASVSFAQETYTETNENSASEGNSQGTSSQTSSGSPNKIPPIVDKAIEAFNEKRYVEAAQLFEKSYDVAPLPRVLKNAMVAWYFAGDCNEAVRVAARYVVSDGSDDSVKKVVNCALDNVDKSLADGEYDELPHLLNVITAAAPDKEQKKRIDADWKKISKYQEKQERSGQPSPYSNQSYQDKTESEDSTSSSTFYSAAPWVATGLLVAGSTSIGIGAWALGSEQPKITAGEALTGLGSLCIFGAGAFFIYWLTTDNPDRDQPANAFQLYDNPQYAENGGMSRIEFSPSLSTEEVSASLKLLF